MAVTVEDRQRFFDLMKNEENLSWEDFWQKWDDDDVEHMIFHGG